MDCFTAQRNNATEDLGQVTAVYFCVVCLRVKLTSAALQTPYTEFVHTVTKA